MFECLLWSTLLAVVTVLPGMGELSHSRTRVDKTPLSANHVCDRFEAPAG